MKDHLQCPRSDEPLDSSCTLSCANAAIINWLADDENVKIRSLARERYEAGDPSVENLWGRLQALLFLLKLDMKQDENLTVEGQQERFEQIREVCEALRERLGDSLASA